MIISFYIVAMVNKKILEIRKKLDKLDNSLLEILKKRSKLVDIVIKNKKLRDKFLTTIIFEKNDEAQDAKNKCKP